MPDRMPSSTLAGMLSSRRRQRFVGRAAEIELFEACLASSTPLFSVLWIYGPGGIGKSALLDAFGVNARRSGVPIGKVDARDLLPTPERIRAAVEDTLAALQSAAADGKPTVLLLDSYERLSEQDDWIRDELFPGLPATLLVVVAGRSRPASSWRADPAWRDLLRVVALRNLTPAESEDYLSRCGIAETQRERLGRLSYGHPLGLSLLADLAVRTGDVGVSLDSPDLVTILLERFLDSVPDVRQRRALTACALARVTTEALLRDALDVEDARAEFDWLRDLSFVEAGPQGLFPHDLARDVIDRDLRWRDPAGYRGVFRRVRAHIHRQLEPLRGESQQRGIFDEKFVFRNLPSILSPVDWQAWGAGLPDPARPGDRPAILDLVGRHEGPAAAAIAEHWLDRQPDAFFVLRHDSSVRGVIALLDLTAASADDRLADPGATAAWAHVQRQGGIRAGQRVTQTRFVVDRDVYQAPSVTLNAVPVATLQRYLSMPELAWDFLTLHEPDAWNDYFALADLPRVPDADFSLGGRRYGLFGHDFRTVPIEPLMELWTERALAEDPGLPPSPAAVPLMLSQPDFAEAVRQGLRDFTRPELLARNPLLRTGLLQGGGASDLAGLLRAAVTSLAVDPRDDKLHRAVEQTYLRRAGTQEAVAARLGLPFSTYRRHLTEGVARVVAWCWEREIYGPRGRVPTAQ